MSPEISVDFHVTALHYIPEIATHIRIHCFGNLKSDNVIDGNSVLIGQLLITSFCIR
jgi:hypothetical protein